MRVQPNTLFPNLGVQDWTKIVDELISGKSVIGTKPLFDSMLDVVANQSKANQKYPPYNLVREENGHVIEMALAGFSISEIDITKLGENNLGNRMYKLTVEGKKNTDKLDIVDDTADQEAVTDYIHNGIALRSFAKTFTFIDDFDVDSAEMKDGMLVIKLTKVIPESMKPTKININKGK
jgi:molecular chaperone IbpA